MNQKIDFVIKQAKLVKYLLNKMDNASKTRQDLPGGSPRARVTSANARWSIACEAYAREFKTLKIMVGDL